MTATNASSFDDAVREALGTRSVVLVGLMGAGKSAIGRKLAQKLSLPFRDADAEIEKAAGQSIAEIFENYGEPEFRRLEERVISRLLGDGPQVLATGGGAFMNASTRSSIGKSGLSIWLSADLDLLMARVSRKATRPLLKQPNPREIMATLIRERYPVYATADIEVASQDITKDQMADRVAKALAKQLEIEPVEGDT